ncbi:iron-phytosiderophore transporter YSL15-like [Brachypodium distachyon]|uniref:Yellow stripe 1B transporter n=1 Tax=Brachypodium distachyon TaxID=15368 RepID=E3UJQ7_BRADI|nr:iron-phytosiderophore transporter YSL15-like [Brachypodium distachyon]ADO64256.1 yellow stripe 1B transporter [Brachypodium distachyon]|eukprot:NP_001266822.1 iron-phytosiderophore transporter YSL15-like [Brachypodium distachyon]
MDVIVPDRSQRVMPEAEIEKQENDEAAEGDMESDPARGGQLQAPPPERWQEELTVRGLVAALLIGFIYTVIVMKILLTTGQVPTLNVSAALIAFLSLQGWTRLLDRLGVPCRPFTRQENTVVQTCVVACYTIAFGGGFGSTLLGLNKRTYEQTGDSAGNVPGSWKEPGIGWMTGFLLAVSFGGLLTLIPLRKVLVIDYKLTYPSGTATAVLINGFHTTQGDKNSKKQIHGFLKYFGLSFFWSFFQWFYTGGDVCGFVQFPTLGLKAWKQTFFFDFSATYIGAGMICPHIVNISTLFGAIISWGLMWPLLSKRKGDWYPANVPESSMKSLYGYKAFICIALIMGDGVYHFTKIIGITSKSMYRQFNRKRVDNRVANVDSAIALDELQRDEVFKRGHISSWMAYTGYALLSVLAVITMPIMFRQVKWYYVILAYAFAPVLGFANSYGTGLTDINMGYNYGKIALFVFAVRNVDNTIALDELQRVEVFKKGHISSWMAYTGYALLSVVAVITMPIMFRQVKWYYVVIAYALAPVLGFANSYGTGLTDINMGYNYGKIALFVFAGWAGKDNGVVAGLVGGTLVKQLVLISADLMHDLKTSYLTLTSPRSMLVGQAIGTAMGCIVSPLTFMLFYKAFDIGNPDGYWKAPYALIYRNMALLGVEGFSVLPKYCLELSGGFFAFAALSSIARDVLPHKYGMYVPLPMAMAVPFLVGGSFAIDMCIGSLVVFIKEKLNKKEAGFMVPAIASGLICGDGIWTFPSSLLALAKIKPPICMKFTPAG